MPTVLALGLDPAFVEFPNNPELSAAIVRAFIEAQLERLRSLGYVVQACLVDLGETAETITSQHLRSQSFGCALIGAGLRAPGYLLLFEKLLNMVHTHAPAAKMCFNNSPADTVEAFQRWV
jgi:hypothetical protein